MPGTFRDSALRRSPLGAFLSLLVLISLPAAAHNLAPAYLELRELAGGEVAVLWKQSAVVPRGVRLEPQLPCPAASVPTARVVDEGVVLEWRIVCAHSLVGERVAVGGLVGSGVDTVLRIALADGRELRAILSEGTPAWVVPARESSARVFASYLRMGVEHLISGLDHVLFVAGLALLLGATRRLVVAISAFTLGHSATLALAALGLASAPQSLVEVAIAATIVALALALTREQPGVIARRAALLPFAFGLLHGLGFAGALAEIGLPQHAIPLALFAFNVGIELAQLAVVALLFVALALLRRVAAAGASSPALLRSARELPATAIGACGVFWCIDRAAVLLFP